MSFDKLIHEYLDEGLNDSDQEALFAEISRNPDVRREFNNQLKMQVITREDMNSIVPPNEATNMVFTRLGFAPPASAGAIESGGLSEFFKSKKFVVGLSAIIIALFSTYYLIDFNNNDQEIASKSSDDFQNEINLNDSKLENKSAESDSESTNFQSLNTVNNISQNLEESDKSNSFSVYDIDNKSDFALNIPDYSSKKNDLSNNKNSLVKKLRNALSNLDLSVQQNSNNIDNPNLMNPVQNDLIQKDPLNDNATLALNLNSDFLIDSSNFNIQLRFISSNSNINSNLPGSDNLLLNNALSFMWKINKKHSVGIEVGLEEVTQEFNENVSGNVIITRQKPEFFWYGLSYKYTETGLTIYNTLVPYTNIFAGSSQFGPVLRGQLGFEIKPVKNSPLVLITAYELSNFFYYSEGGTYNTVNRGLTFGLNYHF